MNRWKTHCQDLLNTATFEHKTFFDSTHTNEIDPEQQEQENKPQDMLYTELAIQSMRNNKSPGIDYIPYTNSTAQEGNLVINILHRLIKGIWIEKKVPTDRKTNIIKSKYTKQGNKLQCHNYKGVSLKCTGYQILTTVINNRLKKYTDDVNGEYQVGFKSGKPTIDEIFTVRIC